MKIFVSGIYASGKTILAKLIAEENKIKYIDFDDLWNYDDNHLVQCQNLFNGILTEDNYVIDAIPYVSGAENGLDKFLDFCSKNKDAFVIFTFCSDFDKWFERLKLSKERFLGDRDKCFQDNFYMNRSYVEIVKDYILLFYDSIDSRYVHWSDFKKLTSWLDK